MAIVTVIKPRVCAHEAWTRKRGGFVRPGAYEEEVWRCNQCGEIRQGPAWVIQYDGYDDKDD